jgi:hypothetical protein
LQDDLVVLHDLPVACLNEHTQHVHNFTAPEVLPVGSKHLVNGPADFLKFLGVADDQFTIVAVDFLDDVHGDVVDGVLGFDEGDEDVAFFGDVVPEFGVVPDERIDGEELPVNDFLVLLFEFLVLLHD